MPKPLGELLELYEADWRRDALKHDTYREDACLLEATFEVHVQSLSAWDLLQRLSVYDDG